MTLRHISVGTGAAGHRLLRWLDSSHSAADSGARCSAASVPHPDCDAETRRRRLRINCAATLRSPARSRAASVWDRRQYQRVRHCGWIGWSPES